MAFFEWWAGLSVWIKVGVAGLLLLLSTIVWFVGYFWPWGWVAGTVLLLFSIPGDRERKGYHD